MIDKIIGTLMIIVGAVNFWYPVPRWIDAAFIVFAGLLYLAVFSKRVQINPPERNKEIR
jgi:uncharacterized membrane protein